MVKQCQLEQNLMLYILVAHIKHIESVFNVSDNKLINSHRVGVVCNATTGALIQRASKKNMNHFLGFPVRSCKESSSIYSTKVFESACNLTRET